MLYSLDISRLAYPTSTQSTFMKKLISLYDGVVNHLSCPQSILLFFIRLVWCFGFMQSGWGTLQNLDKTTEFFASVGIPEPGLNAILVACVELGGGTLLLIGLLSRLAAIPLSITMIVAYITSDPEAVQALFSSEYNKFFEAAPW